MVAEISRETRWSPSDIVFKFNKDEQKSAETILKVLDGIKSYGIRIDSLDELYAVLEYVEIGEY